MVIRTARSDRSLSRLLVAGTLLAGLALGACARNPQNGSNDQVVTGSIGRPTAGADTHADMEAWADRFKSSPSRENALGYAQALRANDQPAQAVAVLQQAMLKTPKDPVIASAYGKALAANGDFDQALKVIRAANSQTTPDWRLLSAEAAILDQLGNSAEARGIYATALKIAPDEPTVLNNLGLSYLLTNDLKAAANPKADSRIRQNLALTLGLEGKFDEAERVAKAELSPDQAAANLAYLKGMLAQQNTWRQIKQAEKS
jgi:Flp pilus assembly protein TadD